jgi:hypothetical protein
VHANPKVAGIIKTVGFIGIEQHLSTDTSIGGSIRTGFERHGAGALAPGARFRKFKLFLNRQLPLGYSHFGAKYQERASLKKPEEQLGVVWDHTWLEADSNKFKTSLGLDHLTRRDQTYSIPATGFKLNRP